MLLVYVLCVDIFELIRTYFFYPMIVTAVARDMKGNAAIKVKQRIGDDSFDSFLNYELLRLIVIFTIKCHASNPHVDIDLVHDYVATLLFSKIELNVEENWQKIKNFIKYLAKHADKIFKVLEGKAQFECTLKKNMSEYRVFELLQSDNEPTTFEINHCNDIAHG